jgi:DNA-binding response OmpR family regulator
MNQFVLIIDDSPTVRKIIEVCLHRAGYAVKSFPDGIEAFHWFNSPQACIPGLVFVDVCLPRKMDGYDILQRLKGRPAFARTVFVMISGRDGVIDRLKGRLAGARDYLVKPLKTAEIVAVVQEYLGTP